MKRGGKNKTRHRNTLEMKAEKRTAMSACDTVTLLATCPVFGTPFQGVPGPVRGYWGGGEGGGRELTFFTSFSISILASVSEEVYSVQTKRTMESEPKRLPKTKKTGRQRNGEIMKQPGLTLRLPSEVLPRMDVKLNGIF